MKYQAKWGPKISTFKPWNSSLVLGLKGHRQRWKSFVENKWTNPRKTSPRQAQDKRTTAWADLWWCLLQGLGQSIQQGRHWRFILHLSFPSVQWHTRQESVRTAVKLQENRAPYLRVSGPCTASQVGSAHQVVIGTLMQRNRSFIPLWHHWQVQQQPWTSNDGIIQ